MNEREVIERKIQLKRQAVLLIEREIYKLERELFRLDWEPYKKQAKLLRGHERG